MNDSAQNAANSSSDFVRKLYKMLEDPSYESVVRWGNEGDSFVVLENEKFTKSILPKHFKHSNFASFVRQLNKYDFHKVRHNNEESGQSPYGAGAWEFKHPDFKANNKDALDNIRRKAPMPKKAAPTAEEMPTQQMDLVNTQLVATQSQLQQLHEKYNELSVHHGMLLQEMMNLQKTVVNHEHVIQNVMSFLHTVDAQQRRTSKVFGNPFASHANDSAAAAAAAAADANNTSHDEDDETPASPLQKATNLLNDVQADEILNSRNLEHMNEMASRLNNTISTPPPSETAFKTSARPSSREPPVSASSATTAPFDIDNLVYPIGQNNGIDPMYSEHIHNIPYPMPSKPEPAAESRFQAPAATQKKAGYDPGWAQQPQVLLVEDDATCRRIGGKFLYAFKCAVDNAMDGLEAVNKLNSGSKYDLILMDIIMPNLDGVSACHLIRQFDHTPIIAMTSNIRSDDIAMYFQHGMNDVLPKPFTKEGLMTMLDKHLGHLKKDYVEPTNSSRSTLKDDDGSAKGSPAAMTASWNSPAHLSGPSSVQGSMSGDDYMMRGNSIYGMGGMGQQHGSLAYGNAGPQTPTNPRLQQQQQQQPHRRHISDISGGDDHTANDSKRQQMYAPQMSMPGSR